MTQDSRQSLIELLFLSLYLDNHLSLAEDEVLTSALEALGWEAELPRELFIFQAFAKAREAAADELKTDAFLSSHADLLANNGTSASALTWLYKILGSDGISMAEERFLKKLEKRLYP
jgi:N-acetylmuramoyl-L-alanine amidase